MQVTVLGFSSSNGPGVNQAPAQGKEKGVAVINTGCLPSFWGHLFQKASSVHLSLQGLLSTLNFNKKPPLTLPMGRVP